MANNTVKITFKGNYLYVKGDQDMILEGIYDSSDMKLMGGALYAFTRDDLKSFVAPDNTLQITHNVNDSAFNYMCSFTKIEAHMMSAAGYPGPTGPAGSTGPKGDKGDTGAAGAQGPAGAAGKDGAKGDKGDTGAAGKPGAKGEAGLAATIAVGNVTSGDVAKVTNTGNENKAIFDFTLPKGDTGAAAGFGVPTVDNSKAGTVGTPTVTVTASGEDTSKIFNFKFENLKGQPGKDAVIDNAEVVPAELPASPGTFYSKDGYVKASEVMKMVKAYCDANCAPAVTDPKSV